MEADPFELELRATFADFAEPYGGTETFPPSVSNTANNSYQDMGSLGEVFVPRHLFQDALIRLCNVFLAPEFIERALERCVDFDHTMNELTLSEFRSLYRR